MFAFLSAAIDSHINTQIARNEKQIKQHWVEFYAKELILFV